MTVHAPLVRRLDDVALLEVHGDDAATWLQGQVTNDLSGAAPGGGVYAAVVDVKGKIVADPWVLVRGDGGFWLAVAAAARDDLAERLDAFVVMEDVELDPRDDLAVVAVAGPGARGVAEAAGVPADRVFEADRVGAGEGVDVVVDRGEVDAVAARLVEAAAAAGGGEGDDAAWHGARIAAGVPAFGLDFGPGRFPQEVGLRDRAVSFRKGCYLGQEAVHMLDVRGKPKRRLARVRAAEATAVDPPGTALRTPDGAQAGTLGLVAAEGLGLAVLRIDQSEPGARLEGEAGGYVVLGDDGGT